MVGWSGHGGRVYPSKDNIGFPQRDITSNNNTIGENKSIHPEPHHCRTSVEGAGSKEIENGLEARGNPVEREFEMSITLPKSKGDFNKKSRNGISLYTLVTHLLVGICGIYIGISLGSLTCTPPDVLEAKEAEPMRGKNAVEKIVEKITKVTEVKFPKRVNKMVVDYATVPRDDFNKLLEIGTPMDYTKKGSEDVFVLYTDPKSVPFQEGSKDKPNNGQKHEMDPEKALENCHTVKVILHEPAGKKRQCIAVVPQWESYHVHKFMRIPKNSNGKEASVEYPLRYVSRSMQDNGKVASVPDWPRHTRASFDALVDYIKSLDSVKEALRPIVKEAVDNHISATDTSKVMKKSKVMVVLVCNKGQSHLFHNFVCNARAKGLDLSRIIMFATDQYTVDLSKSLGIPVFYDDKIFGSMPEKAAGRYGDKVFSMMMMAKVYCVHLVLQLGYDVLFQDVDVVWQKNPLEYLETEESKEWDMIFQDDGSRQVRYQPYSPNTGKFANIRC